MRKTYIPVLFGLMMAVVLPVQASDWRQDQSVTIAVAEKISENLYAAGKAVTVEGETDGDAWMAGWHVTLTGPVRDDVSMAGMTVSASGPVGGDLRLAGRDVTVGGSVGGETIIFASSVQVLGTASIAGDLTVYAEEITISGTVGGNVSLNGTNIVMNGRVAGDASLSAVGDLKVGDGASVAGKTSYSSDKPIIFPASVAGAQYLGSLSNDAGNSSRYNRERDGKGFGDWAMGLAMAIAASLIFFLISRRSMEKLAVDGRDNFWKRCGLGALVLVAMPLALVILCVTLIGIPLAMLGVLAYVALSIVAWALGGAMVGLMLTRRIPKLAHRDFDWKTVVGGTAVLHVVTAVPVLGGIAGLLVFMAVQAVVFVAVWRAVTTWFARH